MRYEVNCKYTEGRFVRNSVLPKNDNFRDLRVELECHSEKSLYAVTVKYLKEIHKLSLPAVVDFRITKLEDKPEVCKYEQLTL